MRFPNVERSTVVLPLIPGTNYKEVRDFLRHHGDRRILPASLDYFECPDRPGLLVLEMDNLFGIIALSGARYTEEGTTDCSITVTHKDFRNGGLGTKVLKAKVSCLETKYQAVVAEDNLPSRRICEKAELKKVNEMTKVRSSGEYTAFLFEGEDKS